MQHLVHNAQTLAYLAHAGQADKGGRPYFGHPARVAQRVAAAGHDDALVAAAWLHDVVEDTGVTLAQLADLGYPARVLHLVGVLTHTPGVARRDYVARIRDVGGPDAVTIKLADIADNTDPDRLAVLPVEDQRRLVDKYARDTAVLVG